FDMLDSSREVADLGGVEIGSRLGPVPVLTALAIEDVHLGVLREQERSDCHGGEGGLAGSWLTAGYGSALVGVLPDGRLSILANAVLKGHSVNVEAGEVRGLGDFGQRFPEFGSALDGSCAD